MRSHHHIEGNAMSTRPIEFHLEPFEHVIAEMMPLLERHFEEISANQDIPLEVDRDGYQKLQDLGTLRIFTARKQGQLIGYSVYFIHHNLHYKSSLQAVQDVLFIDKEHRKGTVGGHLIKWCDNQLRSEGVQVVYHHVKAAHNFGPLLERIGYKLVDLIYARRLDT